MRTFTHAGDLGDIIYSLPAIKACGGGKLILFDQPGRTAHGMSEGKAKRLATLLEYQDYIHSVEFSATQVDSPLNGFRDHLGVHGTLTDGHLATQGLSWEHRVETWLRVPSVRSEWPVVISRSPRYHNDRFPWGAVVEKYGGVCGFLGFPEEHGEFCDRFGHVPLIDAPDFMEVGRVIAGSKLFFGNQSSPLAVAHGLKHPATFMEICPGGPQQHCVFQRLGCVIVWDEKVEFPPVPTSAPITRPATVEQY